MVCSLVDMVLVSEWKIIVMRLVAFLIWIYADLEHGEEYVSTRDRAREYITKR
jgi:hypothetical protein